MEQELSHELLSRLLNDDYTILFAAGQGNQNACVFLPINVEVGDFMESTSFIDYSGDKFLIIEDALKLLPEELSRHKVIM